MGSSVGSTHTSEVSLLELSSTMNAWLRVTPTETKKRASSSWNTSTSSAVGRPRWWRHTCHGRMAASGRT